MNNIKNKNKMVELYGETEEQGYSGLFSGKVYYLNQRNLNAFPETSELSRHLHQNWHEKPVSSIYRYQHRDIGEETILDFFLERKMPCPPHFQFEFENKHYTMRFTYSAPDGKKSTGKTGKKSGKAFKGCAGCKDKSRGYKNKAKRSK